MSEEAEEVVKYDSPALELTITGNHGGGLSWKVRMQAVDAKRTRLLDYRAKGDGLISDLSPPIFDIEVRDDGKSVWTPMPKSHRTEVREAIVALLSNALASMKSVSSL
ncbi:MAG: hypothetical protein ABI398_05885 [Devosia sp.]